MDENQVELKMAPLAHQSSFSSCQEGSGYQTPDDDDENEVSTAEEHSIRSVSSCSILSPNSEEFLHEIRIHCEECTQNEPTYLETAKELPILNRLKIPLRGLLTKDNLVS